MSWRWPTAAWAAFLLVAPAAPAPAHGVRVAAWVEDGEVKVEAFTSRGAPLKRCAVSVRGADGTLRHTLTTDDEGRCAFQPERAEDLTIRLDAGPGHRDECTVKASQLAGVGEAPAEPRPTAAETSPAASVSSAGEAARLESELAALREQVRELEKARRQVSTRDVIAGLGFIFGVTALVYALTRGRRESRAD